MSQDMDRPTEDDGHTVLEVFGLKLEVSNPRLAELLTMDAREALSTDVRDLSDPDKRRETVAEIEQAAPEGMVAPPTARDEQEARQRKELREHALQLGERLGFTTRPDGVWESPTGVDILTRVVSKQLSYAAAAHFVAELNEHRKTACGEDCTLLFITESQQTADVFKVAIRQRQQYDLMRTASLDNLESVTEMCEAGRIDHAQALVLLAPVANIDLGEMLSVIRSTAEVAAGPEGRDRPESGPASGAAEE